jgi:hypothetical protein
MLYIKSLPAFEPQWVVRIEWEVRGRMCLLVNPPGPNTSVGKCSTLILQPAIDVGAVMQVIKDFKPIMQIRVSPVRLDHSVDRLVGGSVNIRFVRGHPFGP